MRFTGRDKSNLENLIYMMEIKMSLNLIMDNQRQIKDPLLLYLNSWRDDKDEL